MPAAKRKLLRFTERLKSKKLLFVMAAIIVSVWGSYATLAVITPVGATVVGEGQHAVDQPIEILLSPTVRQVNLEQITMRPDAKGEWSIAKGSLGKSDKLIFTPKEPLIVDTVYQIDLPELIHIAGAHNRVPTLKFKTEEAPGLDSSGLNGLQNNQVITADYKIHVKLTSQNRGLRQLELRSKPQLKLTKNVVDDQEYHWSYDGLLPQGKKLEFEIYDTKNQQSLLRRSVKVAEAPSLKARAKASYFLPGDNATLQFNQPIDESSRKQTEQIVFSVEGEGRWKSSAEYQFTPRDLKPGTQYSYTVKKGLRTKDGGILTKNLSFDFATRGAVSASIPFIGYEVNQRQQQIKFVFDQEVDRASAEKRLRTTHGEITSKIWSGNTLSVGLKNLGFQKTVTVKVLAGVVNKGFGLPSARELSTTFTTEVRSRRLNVPHYQQQKSGTCVAAALRMTLGYYGINRDEMTLVRAMGYKPRDMDRSKKPYIWDDPAEMYVGRVDGKTYYEVAGPDAEPAAKAATISGRSAQAVRGINAEWIAAQIYQGRPVIMYGAMKDSGFITWKTPSGKTAKMNLSSHATVVTGVKGEANNPLGFWVNDPMAGRNAYWSIDAVRTNIARDAYQQAVVVY